MQALWKVVRGGRGSETLASVPEETEEGEGEDIMGPELYDLWEKAAAELDRAHHNSGAIANRKLAEQVEAIRAGSASANFVKYEHDDRFRAVRFTIEFSDGFTVSWINKEGEA
jgi:hypothetical protein